MSPRRKGGLGRGLGALIPSLSSSVAIDEVDIDLIVPNPQQPRTVFDQESIAELAQSIREHGVIQPLIVSRLEADGGAPIYQLIAGERRLYAARQAGLQRLPVVIKEASSQSLLELALVENLQREDLGPLEEAAAFRRLSDEFGMTQEAVAERVGRSRPAVANSLRLLTLPAEIQASLVKREITPGHARALLAIEDQTERRRAWQRILRSGLTVRDAEELAKGKKRRGKNAGNADERRLSPDDAALEERLRSALGTKVDLIKGRKGGRLTIHFYSDEELEAIIERLG